MSSKSSHKKATLSVPKINKKTYPKCLQKVSIKNQQKKPTPNAPKNNFWNGLVSALQTTKTRSHRKRKAWFAERSKNMARCEKTTPNQMLFVKLGKRFLPNQKRLWVKNVGDRLEIDREMTNLKKEQIKFWKNHLKNKRVGCKETVSFRTSNFTKNKELGNEGLC